MYWCTKINKSFILKSLTGKRALWISLDVLLAAQKGLILGGESYLVMHCHLNSKVTVWVAVEHCRLHWHVTFHAWRHCWHFHWHSRRGGHAHIHQHHRIHTAHQSSNLHYVQALGWSIGLNVAVFAVIFNTSNISNIGHLLKVICRITRPMVPLAQLVFCIQNFLQCTYTMLYYTMSYCGNGTSIDACELWADMMNFSSPQDSLPYHRSGSCPYWGPYPCPCHHPCPAKLTHLTKTTTGMLNIARTHLLRKVSSLVWFTVWHICNLYWVTVAHILIIVPRMQDQSAKCNGALRPDLKETEVQFI